MKEKHFHTGLVLSGGGVRGLAHLGVMKAMHEEGIFPDVISGVSAGAIAGALYCDGYDPEEILEIFMKHKLLKYVEFTLPRKSLGNISGLKKFLSSKLRAKTFSELKIPLFISATDLNHGKSVCFSAGDLVTVLIASSSIPVIFPPVLINKIHYADGGIMNNLPTEPLEGKCRCIIGVNSNPVSYHDDFKSILSIAERLLHLGVEAQKVLKMNKFDIFIEPPRLDKFRIFEISKGREIFKIGYNEAKRVLKAIQKEAAGIG